MILLKVRGLKAYYEVRGGYVKAVDGVSINLEEDVILGVAGESGCGKSTLANALMMNIKPPLRLVEGIVEINGITISKMDKDFLKKNVWGKLVSLIPQSALNALMPTMKIKDFIIEVVKQHEELDESEIVSMAEKRFEELGLPVTALNLYPHELSGGMRQRVCIAMSICLNPKLVFADEPITGLDVVMQKLNLQTLGDLRDKFGITVVMVAHDMACHAEICDRICIMYAGKVLEIGSTFDIFSDPLHPYTKGLLSAVPSLEKKDLKGIPGLAPSPLEWPSGCRFHPRCSYRMKICEEQEPILKEVQPGRSVACFLYGGE